MYPKFQILICDLSIINFDRHYLGQFAVFQNVGHMGLFRRVSLASLRSLRLIGILNKMLKGVKLRLPEWP